MVPFKSYSSFFYGANSTWTGYSDSVANDNKVLHLGEKENTKSLTRILHTSLVYQQAITITL